MFNIMAWSFLMVVLPIYVVMIVKDMYVEVD